MPLMLSERRDVPVSPDEPGETGAWLQGYATNESSQAFVSENT